MTSTNNLNLSLKFDSFKKFLLCGELVKFHLKISSPEFDENGAPEDFLERIGAAVEAIEITEESSGSALSSLNSSIDSLRGRKMKSVESLSNLLRSVDQQRRGGSQNQSQDSQNSQHSMSSATVKRFNSLSQNRSSEVKPFWSSEEAAILIPLEAFIDPECLASSSNRGNAKFKVSLNELVPIDALETLRMGFGKMGWSDSISSAAQSSHKLQKIGQIETSLTVLRPLEVSLRTHNLSANQVILQINVEFNHQHRNETVTDDYAADLNGNLEIKSVNIELSDSFTTRSQTSSLFDYNNYFKITPMSNSQIPFTFETSPQQYSLLFRWSLLNRPQIFDTENFHLRVELSGELNRNSEISLSFESALPIFNLFPPLNVSGIQITSSKLIGNPVRVFQPLQLEFILHNYENEDCTNLVLNVLTSPQSTDFERKQTNNPVEEWFKMERMRKCPGLLLLSPLTPLKIDTIPSGGSKSIRLKFVPVQRGIFRLKEEFKIQNIATAKTETEPVEEKLNVKNEKWILYTLDTESKECPMDCIIVNNYFKFVKPETLISKNIVKCSSCSPNGILPILVAESNGCVLEVAEIYKNFFEIEDISLYASIDGLLGGYIRAFSKQSCFESIPSSIDVIEFIDNLQSARMEPAVAVLLYSLIQGVKMHLNHNDPVRMAVERSEFLNELFINLLESVKK